MERKVISIRFESMIKSSKKKKQSKQERRKKKAQNYAEEKGRKENTSK